MAVRNAWVEKPQREGDLFLMDVIVKVITNPVCLRRINDVRLYLRVSRLSDIATLAGNQLSQWELYGPPREGSELTWLPRRKPLAENLKLWRSALHQTVTASFGLYPGNLGAFLTSQLPVVMRYNDGVQDANAKLAALPPARRQLCGKFQFTSTMFSDF